MEHTYNCNFPTPSYLAMKSFAVDISDQSVKYGELLVTSQGLRLGRFGKEKITEGVVVSGKIEKEETLIRTLKNIKDKLKLKFVRVSLPEEQMYLFTLSLPIVNEENLRDVILLQIEEHIPLKAIDTVFNFEVISRSSNNFLVEVSAIAAGTVQSYLSVFEKSGLAVLSFELEAQAIARAIIPNDDKDPVMIVDFGDTRTGVSIVHGGKVFFTTTLDMGGINLTNMIAKNFSLSFEKAEEMKRSYGLDGISNIEDIFPVILNGISVLRDELNKQYQYWRSHDDLGIKQGEITRIVLCGGDSNLTGLSDYLEASMKIKVEHANAWVNISQMDISVPDMSFEESLSYATVLGLALGSFSNKSPIVNVLPEEERRILHNEYWKRFSVVSIWIFCLIISVAISLLAPSYFFSASKEEITENRLEEFNASNSNFDPKVLDNIILDINSNLDLISSVGKKTMLYTDMIGGILELRPKGITFSQILYGQKKDKTFYINIHGIAVDRAALSNFKAILDGYDKIKSSDLPISSFIEKSNLNFSIDIVMK